MPAYRFREDYMLTSDGVKLLTRTVYPMNYKDGDCLPCVIHRTPYEAPVDKWPFDPVTFGRVMTDFLERGYIYVNQHCRGTGSSEGEFRNMTSERPDGLELLDWVRGQKWYNGEIYLWGNSYKSYVHSCILDTNPPDVKAAALAVMPADQSFSCYEKGTFKHDLITMWFAKTFRKNQLDTAQIYSRMKKELRVRPLRDLTRRVYGENVPEITNCFLNPIGSEYWSREDTDLGHAYAAPSKTKIPILLIGGEYDIHFRGTLEYWRALPPEQKARSAAFFGPWTHCLGTLPEHKPLFPASGHPPVEAEWFDFWRCGGAQASEIETIDGTAGNSASAVQSAPESAKTATDAKNQLHYVSLGQLTYYMPGEGWCRSADAWKESGSAKVKMYLNADNVLDTSAGASVPLSYTYDPEDPLSLPGGASIFQTERRGPQPQPEPGFRQDLLSFVSAPLDRSLRIDGPVHVSLSVSSDCPDTAFFVRINLVRGGTAWCLRDTIVSVSELVKDYIPGSKVRLDFDLAPVTFLCGPKDALRIDVSSSDFPCYNAHANTLEPWYDAVETRIAHNTVYAGESYIEL